jgi:L-rhamnono-1,4-lactonase
MPIPIVDSHIHLFPENHAATLAWQRPDGPLFGQYSVDEYRVAAESDSVSTTIQPKDTTYLLRGFVFLETDRISSLDESAGGWDLALDEVSLITRIALGTPVSGEGHKPEDSALCLGIVPWAPVPLGSASLEHYMNVVRKRVQSEEVFKKVRGVRYLVQDKPSGIMLKEEFIEGLKWLGKRSLSFDIGVDAMRGGLWQLKEAAEMIRRAHDGVSEEEKVVFVISMLSIFPAKIVQTAVDDKLSPDHLCKPNVRVPCDTIESIKKHPDFIEWKAHITAMAAHRKTYMKITADS